MDITSSTEAVASPSTLGEHRNIEGGGHLRIIDSEPAQNRQSSGSPGRINNGLSPGGVDRRRSSERNRVTSRAGLEVGIIVSLFSPLCLILPNAIYFVVGSHD